MDKDKIEDIADELFIPFEDYAFNMQLDDALSLAEALEIRFSYYTDGIRAHLRALL